MKTTPILAAPSARYASRPRTWWVSMILPVPRRSIEPRHGIGRGAPARWTSPPTNSVRLSARRRRGLRCRSRPALDLAEASVAQVNVGTPASLEPRSRSALFQLDQCLEPATGACGVDRLLRVSDSQRQSPCLDLRLQEGGDLLLVLTGSLVSRKSVSILAAATTVRRSSAGALNETAATKVNARRARTTMPRDAPTQGSRQDLQFRCRAATAKATAERRVRTLCRH